MFENDILLAFAFMALLFLRQIAILKQPNKINYAPLMIGIGAISSIVHFIIHPDSQDIMLHFRESLFPFLVALLLYIVMNILHQTQVSQEARNKEEFSKVLVGEVTQLKNFILELETRMSEAQKEDREVQENIRVKFKEDIKALVTIEKNQQLFIEKFDEMQEWHKSVSKGFDDFTNVQLPELDNVVHKHIDILRVAEQDHYNKLTSILQNAVKSRVDMSSEIDELKRNINSIKTASDEISKSIIKSTIDKLSSVTKSFEVQIISLKSHSEDIETSLCEGENRLQGIKTQSEMIMKQMILSSNKMNELEKQNSGLGDINASMKGLISEVEAIKSDYVKSQAQLSLIATELSLSKEKQVLEMKTQIDSLSEGISHKIDESLEKLHKHYHIAGEDITQSVQVLSSRAKLQKGYTELD